MSKLTLETLKREVIEKQLDRASDELSSMNSKKNILNSSPFISYTTKGERKE